MTDTTDHLDAAKASWNAIPGSDGSPTMLASLASAAALISIAGSLALIADQPNAIQIINSRLRGIENDLDELDERLRKHLPKDAEHISAAGESDLSHAQAESVDLSTPEDSEAVERQLVEEVARAICATYMAVNPEVSTWVDLANEVEEYRNEARAALAAIRERHVIEPKPIAGTEAASAYFDAYFPDVHSLLDAITATHTKPEVEA